MDKIYLKGLLFYFYIFHHCSFSIARQRFKPTPNPSESTCILREAIFRAGYVKKCDRLLSDTHLQHCTPNNIDECLCSAIDETAHEICKLQMNFDAKFDFDDELIKLQHAVKPDAFCNYTINLISNPAYQGRFQPTSSFPLIVQLNDVLRTNCPKICVGWDDSIKWFCSALVTVDKLLVETLPRGKSISPISSIDDPKVNASSSANSQVETSKQPKSAQPGSEKSENEDKGNKTSDHQPDTEIEPPALIHVTTSDTKPAQQKDDQQTQGSASEVQRTGTIVGTPKVQLRPNDPPKPPGSDPRTNVDSHSTKVPSAPLTASTVSSTAYLQPDNPPESVPEHEDDFDGESDTDLERPDVSDKHLKGPTSNDAENIASSRVNENDIIHPNSPIHNPIMDVQEESHLFVYFMALSLISIIAYIGFHNKHKIFAIVLEGKPSRGGRSRRRPNTAGYRKLDCNLEEAVTSQCNSNVTHVIY